MMLEQSPSCINIQAQISALSPLKREAVSQNNESTSPNNNGENDEQIHYGNGNNYNHNFYNQGYEEMRSKNSHVQSISTDLRKFVE